MFVTHDPLTSTRSTWIEPQIDGVSKLKITHNACPSATTPRLTLDVFQSEGRSYNKYFAPSGRAPNSEVSNDMAKPEESGLKWHTPTLAKAYALGRGSYYDTLVVLDRYRSTDEAMQSW